MEINRQSLSGSRKKSKIYIWGVERLGKTDKTFRVNSSIGGAGRGVNKTPRAGKLICQREI